MGGNQAPSTAAEVDKAKLYEAQAVIDPRDTRAFLKETLEVHRLRLTGGIGRHLLANWPTSY